MSKRPRETRAGAREATADLKEDPNPQTSATSGVQSLLATLLWAPVR